MVSNPQPIGQHRERVLASAAALPVICPPGRGGGGPPAGWPASGAGVGRCRCAASDLPARARWWWTPCRLASIGIRYRPVPACGAVVGHPLPVGQYRDQVLAGARRAAGRRRGDPQPVGQHWERVLVRCSCLSEPPRIHI
ncbi:hypothetical protein [Aeromonas sp. Y311-2]|uniref:hypothetical protein n=1 Tax=Aeromonas sp. Y311-2 TaxID=2990507 RepID=UPI0022E13166|nr:hypothetical protein [Aeromonas sp. Y311-2]